MSIVRALCAGRLPGWSRAASRHRAGFRLQVAEVFLPSGRDGHFCLPVTHVATALDVADAGVQVVPLAGDEAVHAEAPLLVRGRLAAGEIPPGAGADAERPVE